MTSRFNAQISEGEYNAIDLAATQGIFDKMVKEGGVEAAAFDHAMLGPGLTMGMRGIRVDDKRREAILKTTLEDAKQWWSKLEPHGFTQGKALAPSPYQLQKVLYGQLKAPVQYNKDGNPSCDRNALTKIIESPRANDGAVEVAKVALELRRLEEDRKVLTKHIGADGRMHTGFGVAATVTSRWSSSSDPFNEGANFHALSRRVRQIFIPDRGCVFVSFDLKQAESYTVAFLANSPWYKKAHQDGNVHVLVGSRIWPEAFAGGKKSAKDTPLPWAPDQDYYDLAKRTQHGFNYLLSPYGFARQAKMPVANAKEIRSDYFALVPEVEEWHRATANEIRTKHRLTTPMGRDRIFLGRPWEESTVKEAVAHVPQSTVSDINKIILWRIWHYLDPVACQVLLEVHDSVLFQVKETDMDTVRQAFSYTPVEVPINGDVMIIGADAQLGDNWGDYDKATNPNGLWDKRLEGVLN